MMSKQQSKASIQRLITLERVQKLDLLIHLISNLSQSLIICGPEGIGKTTILDAMLEYKKDSWPICLLQGTSSLSFESILEKFLQQLTQLLPEYAGQNLSAILETNNKQNQKLVLIVDDAGMLVPGLISALIEFSHANSSLRLVFSLTHDELHIKNSTDRFIDECHLIEIPPITKKQCTVFLQNLSAQPGAVISFNGVTEGFVDNLYRQTHGIPGKIVTELPRLARDKPTGGLKWGTGSFIIIAIVCAVTLFYFSKPDSQVIKTQLAEQLLIKKTVVAVEIASPVIQSEKYERIDSEVDHFKKPENNKKETTTIVVEQEKSEDLPDKEKIIEEIEKEHLIAKDEAIEPVQAITELIVVEEEKSEDLPDKDKIVEEIEKEPLIVKDEAIEPVQAITELIEVEEEKSEDLPDKDKIVEETEKEPLIVKDEAIKPVQTITELIEVEEEKSEDLPDKDKIVEEIEKEPLIAKDEAIGPVPAITELIEVKAEVVKQGVAITEKQAVVNKSIETVPAAKTEKVVLGDADWISSQAAEHYTMQLMVLSKRQSVEKLLKKYQDYKDLLKYFQVKKKGQSKYVVIYGSYKTSTDAAKAKQTLPTELRKVWVRKFKALQKQLKAK